LVPAGASADAPVTFTKDVAPILFRYCAACHHDGGPGPFNLITYDDARRRAAQIVKVTQSRFMPPWKPEPGGVHFAGERRLTEAQIRALERWMTDGAPEGNRAELPPPPRFAAGWQLGTPDLVLTLPEYVLRADGADVFRNFVVPVPGAGPHFVRALEFRAGNASIHHANIRVDPTRASRQRDEADPAPGYEGEILRSADFPDGHFLGWTPGQAPPLPDDDLAWRLADGSDIVVQLHLRPTGRIERLQPAIGLYFASRPPSRVPAIVRLGVQDIDIPPGTANYKLSDQFVLPVDAQLRAIQPHAHYRAQTVTAWATLPSGERRSLIDIKAWDFNWQDQYRYAEPFWVPAGTRLAMEYVFDNTATNPRNPDRPPRRVSWGWRSSDEMADVWIQMMTRSDADRLRLVADARRKMAAADVIGCETMISREPEYVAVRNDAASLYMELGRPDRALLHFEAVRRLQPTSAAHFNVGVALEALGRSGEAASEYEAAVRIDPAYSSAHNNLGNLRLAAGRLAEARQEYERAVEHGPSNAEAHNNLGAVLIVDDPARAIALLQRAIALRPEYPEAYFNLTRALAAAGRLDEARRTAAIAEEHARAAGKAELVEQIRALRRSYERR
jgi:tetratricopeptide (TPR) repeat protein